jgi:RNA polymerase sigma-70 factor (ECF subfamily)
MKHVKGVPRTYDHIELGEVTGDSLEFSELQQMVNAAINSLPPRCKAIFVLSREEALSYRQIAEELDVSVKTVEAQMSIALKRMRSYLTDRGISWIYLCMMGLAPF